METSVFDTLSGAIGQLQADGYTIDFNLRENALECRHDGVQISHDDFVIDKYFRFEGMTDPADEAILYAISVPEHNLKGLLVNGYGIYSDPLSNEMMRKLNPGTPAN
jgi:hypothetical protein